MNGQHPADLGRLSRLRRERRAFVREQHPDRGGDPAAFAAGLARFDDLLRDAGGLPPVVTREPSGQVRVVVVRRPTGVGGWLRHLARQLDQHSRRRPPRAR